MSGRLDGSESLLSALVDSVDVVSFCVSVGCVDLTRTTSGQAMLVQGLARPRPALRHATLSACLTLAGRPLLASQFSAHDLSAYVMHVLSVPGLVTHLQGTAPEVSAGPAAACSAGPESRVLGGACCEFSWRLNVYARCCQLWFHVY